MTGFVLAASILLLLVIGALLWPLLRRQVSVEAADESPALRILREQRADLEADHANGVVSADVYAQNLAELQRRALDESALPETMANRKQSRVWALFVALLLPALAVGIYLKIGNPAGLDPALVAPPAPISAGQIDAMVEKLAQRVAANPDDLEGQRMLARSYIVLERFADAVKVLEALASKLPNDAQVYADWADALASTRGNKLAGEPEKLIAKAVALDPKNVKALALAGTVAFDKQDFKGALAHWEAMLPLVDPASEFGRSVRAMVGEARNKAGLPPLAEPSTPAGSLQVSGRIELDKELAAAIAPDDTLFVFARPAQGGPPLAGMRFSAADLPLDFSFANAQIMNAGNGVPEKLIIGARISKSGKPGASPGDLQGFSAPVPSDAKGVAIKIGEQVK